MHAWPVNYATNICHRRASFRSLRCRRHGSKVSFAESLSGEREDKQLAMAPSQLQAFIQTVRERFDASANAGDSPVLLTSPLVRPYVRSIIERFRSQTPVMSQNEIHRSVRLRTMGQI